MKSIRREITVWLLVAMSVLFAAFGAGLYRYVSRVLLDRFDDDLLSQAADLSAFTMQEPDGHIEFELNPVATPQFHDSKAPQYYQLWYDGGETLARSPSLGSHDLRPLSQVAGTHFTDLRLPDGRDGRAVAIRFKPLVELIGGRLPAILPPPPPQMIVMVAREREQLDGTLSTISGFCFAGSLVIVAGGAFVVAVIVNRGTRPLRRAADEVESLQPDTLDRRLPCDDLPLELRPIVEKINGLLERVDNVVRRERRFTADAAHELRTPVAELRTLTEVASAWPSEDPNVGQAFKDAKDIATQMESLIAALLDLSRQEAGTLQVRRAAIDLCPVVREIHRTLEASHRASQSAVELNLPQSASIETDPVLARACIHNLLDNAMKHSPPGAHVFCELTASNGQVLLQITNPCDELTPEDVQHIGEPFWQKNAARSSAEHSGLGVALVKAYAKAISADLSLEIISGGNFKAQLRFAAGDPSDNAGDLKRHR